jgi:hypothetical protein
VLHPTPEGTFQQQPPQSVQRFDRYRIIRRLLKTMALDIVLVADVNVPIKHWEALASLCEKEPVQSKVVPSYFSILVSGLHLETLSGIPFLGVSRLPLDRMFNKLIKIKRVIDIVGSIVGLLLSAPLVAIFGALVHLESPGPILDRERRLRIRGFMRKWNLLFDLQTMFLTFCEKKNAQWTHKYPSAASLRGGTAAMANPSPLEHLVDLTVHERHLIELNPNRKVATKGGSMAGIFQMQNECSNLQNKGCKHAFN